MNAGQLCEHVRICEQGLASSSFACNPSVSHFFLCHGTRQELIKALHLGKIRWDGRQPKRESTTAFHISDSSCSFCTDIMFMWFMRLCTLMYFAFVSSVHLSTQCHLFLRRSIFAFCLHFVNWSLPLLVSPGGTGLTPSDQTGTEPGM